LWHILLTFSVEYSRCVAQAQNVWLVRKLGRLTRLDGMEGRTECLNRILFEHSFSKGCENALIDIDTDERRRAGIGELPFS
jgi:hypothetical protein